MWEKAGVNVSVVYGSMPPEAYRAATGVSLQGSVRSSGSRVQDVGYRFAQVRRPVVSPGADYSLQGPM